MLRGTPAERDENSKFGKCRQTRLENDVSPLSLYRYGTDSTAFNITHHCRVYFLASFNHLQIQDKLRSDICRDDSTR
jgi:hypothetical protein